MSIIITVSLLQFLLSGILAPKFCMKKYDQFEVLDNEERREVLTDTKTIFAPESTCLNHKINHYSTKDKNSFFNGLEQFNLMDTEEKCVASLGPDDERCLVKCDVLAQDERIQKVYVAFHNISNNLANIASVQDICHIDNENSTGLQNKSNFWTNQMDVKEVRCLQSKTMKKYINPDINPCNDFYEFACGNWKKYYKVPPEKSTYDVFEMVRENLDSVLKELLEEEYPPEKVSQTEQPTKINFLDLNLAPNNTGDATIKAKIFYQSCMNQETIGKRKTEPLMKIVNELGGWPLISSNWSSTTFDLIWLLARLKLLNNDVLVAEWIGPDIKNSNEYIVHIDQTTLGLPAREYYLDHSYIRYVSAYKIFIITVAELISGKNKNLEQEVDDMIKFETQLAEIVASMDDRRNISDMYLRIDLASMTLYFPQFDWKSYFDVILGKNVDLQTPVACYCVKYLHDLFYLLSITSKKVLQNYLIWRFVRHRTSNLDEKFLEAKQRFYYILFGKEKQLPRWQFCVAQVNSNMGMALGSLFVRKYFDETSKTDTTQMTKELEEAFKSILEENTWLDNHTKDYAKMKINLMDLKIGYPDFILNEAELSARYNDIEVHKDFFFENILSILRHLTWSEKKRIGSTANRTLWSTQPAVVNAYYSRNKNQIMFPAGMLQPPFYHKHFPKALNFGGIGVVIGHEITHGFDDKGRLFDQEGNLHMWWRESSIVKFYEKSQCMIDQYSQYMLPELKVALDGYLTQGENIADNGGLKEAFRAYETWLSKNSEADESLPDLNLTGKQLFFLNFAQVWCGQQKIEAAVNRMKTSVHSPGIFRVIGVLSNSEDFAKVYNCPRNSPMNPERKCTIW